MAKYDQEDEGQRGNGHNIKAFSSTYVLRNGNLWKGNSYHEERQGDLEDECLLSVYPDCTDTLYPYFVW